MRTSRSSSLVPFRYFTARSASGRLWYSTKQNPHGVFRFLSRPITMAFTGPARENKSQICSSLV